MLVVFTGNGKGKTTAALGQMLRAHGQGKRVAMFQFIKGPWVSGEHLFVKRFQKNTKDFFIYRGGKGFVGILGDSLPFSEHKKSAHDTLKKIQKAVASKQWDMIVCDEINVAVFLKLIRASDVLRVIAKAPKSVVIVFTGRNAPNSFIKKADLVTEMKDIKHPYARGKKACVGFEF